MADCAVENYGPLPFLFVGGVMSNKFFRENLSDKFEAVFASPELSCDNAAGTSFLGKLKFNNLI